MGIDSKGFCLTENKDVFNICGQVEKSLNELIHKYKKNKFKNPVYFPQIDENNRDVRVEINPSLEMALFIFRLKEENRIIHLHFGCDRSYESEFPGKKLIWSLGFWGNHEEIMSVVASSLSSFGDVYIDNNDSDSVGFELRHQILSLNNKKSIQI